VRIRLKISDRDAIIAQARSGIPDEICGLIAGSEDGESKMIEKIYPMINMDASAEHFTVDPREHLASIRDMRANGLKPLGNYHSHPNTPSRPSAEDIRLAFDPSASYMIVSLAGSEPVLKSFHIESGVSSEEEIEIL
jgi:proteasome lid subunit RPN8/RPN11